MRRRLILSLIAAALALAPAAFAAEAAKKADDSGGLYMDLSTVGLPVIQNGRLVNYVFTQIRLILQPGSNPVALRAKEPYFRDALVRAAHRTPFTLAGDPNRLDDAAMKRALMTEAVRIAGPRAIASVVVVDETPKRRLPKS